MKKIIALALALVLALGLATVAFAEDVKLDPAEGGEKYCDQNPIFKSTVGDDVTYDEEFTANLCIDGSAKKFVLIDFAELGVTDVTEADFTKAIELNVTENASLASFEYKFEYANEAKKILAKVWLVITPKDNVVAVNQTVKGNIKFVDSFAQTVRVKNYAKFAFGLLNHYINVKTKDGKLANAPIVNAEGVAVDVPFDSNDILKALETKTHNIILNANHEDDNVDVAPAYVVHADQLATVANNDFVNFVWEGIATIKINNIGGQEQGLNFKVLVEPRTFTRAELNANINSKAVYVKFPCAATLDVTGAITFDVAGLKAALGYSSEKEMPIYIYTSDDAGKTYALKAKGDLAAKDAEVVVELAKGDTLGYYLFSNVELEASGKAPEKSNTATGASEMVSVCVALAVVSLVAAGAVTVKKISK